MAKKQVNANVFKLAHTLGKMLTDWTKEVKDDFKNGDLDFTCMTQDKTGKDTIYIYEAPATPYRGEEYEKELKILQEKYPVLNTEEKILKVKINDLTKAKEEAQVIFNELSNNNIRNIARVARAASGVKTTKQK